MIISTLVDHPRVVIAISVVVLVVLAGFALVRVGERRGASTAAAIAAVAQRAADSVAAEATRARAVVRAENDSLHVANVSLWAANAKLSSLVAERRTAVTASRAQLPLTLLPPDQAQQLATERAVTDSAFRTMDLRHSNDLALIRGLVAENDGLRHEIQLDSTIAISYRTELAAAYARVDAAEQAHVSPIKVFASGVLAAVVAAATLAVVF